MLKSSVTENKNTSFATKSKDVNLNQQSNVNNDSSALNQHKKVVDKLDEKVEDSKKLENHNVNALSNEALENINDPNEDIKTSTISEDTQDHENSANQNNWNHGDTPNDANDAPDMIIDTGDQGQNIPDPSEQRDDIISHYHNITSEEESHFFTYFTVVSLISIAAYIGYHNKQKILAIVLEGRRSRNSRGRRRPSTANYRKLNCTLEEAVTSQCNANVTHVIY
ncbi:Trans-Golgi network integral membrane protein 1 [Habropoda laboriosa]|uniref:Trans-Golgi network integral membrane protein 1 n=2 Tax=Habropoda laboriosa TaxID=597456 RepID=A0A0L7QZE3_9HYME|nr:Trans-Golgi network integral membrane protein 1 [Habropoda laboriosa]